MHPHAGAPVNSAYRLICWFCASAKPIDERFLCALGRGSPPGQASNRLSAGTSTLAPGRPNAACSPVAQCGKIFMRLPWRKGQSLPIRGFSRVHPPWRPGSQTQLVVEQARGAKFCGIDRTGGFSNRGPSVTFTKCCHPAELNFFQQNTVKVSPPKSTKTRIQQPIPASLKNYNRQPL